MIAPAPKDYLLLREVASRVGLSVKLLRQQVALGHIPARFVLRSGAVRPVVRIHRSWLEQEAPRAALTCEAVLPWGGA